jgi:hypothetical protein
MAHHSLLRPARTDRHFSTLRRGAGSATLGLLAAAALAVSTSGTAWASGNLGSKSAGQITSASIKAGKSAKSVTIKGSVADSGQTISLNITDLANGNGAGSITIGGQTIQLVKLGNSSYFKADTAFWQKNGGSGAAQLLANRWVKSPTSGSDSIGSSFNQFLSIKGFLSSLSSSTGTLSKGGTSTVNGHKVYVINSSEGGSLYIAAIGKPYPVKITSTGSSSGTITLTNWNKHVTITAPAGAIDMNKLGSGS